MTRTLDRYLGKDLAKATALAALSFTLVLTILAVIEPLRKQGLSGTQAMALFGYSLPLSLSLALPVGALFAATIVYGRFAQDNELMACRASGVCTLTLMKPALILAAIVSVITLTLGLYVAPKLWRVSERTIKHNLEKITYHYLKSRGHINITKERWLFHADRVDEERQWVYGAVLVNYDDKGGSRCVVASSAKLEFPQRDGSTSVLFHFTQPTFFTQSGGTQAGEGEQPITVLELPGMPDDKPRFYGWKELWDTWRRPAENRSIKRRSREIRQALVVGMLCRDVVDEIGARGVYDGLTELTAPTERAERKRLEIRAPAAWLHERMSARLGPGPGAVATGRSVIVRELIGDQLSREFRAAAASIEGSWPKHEKRAKVSLTLTDVDVRTSLLDGQAHHRAEATLGPFAVSEDVLRRAEKVELPDLVANPEKYNAPEHVAAKAKGLYGKEQGRLLAKVRAEIHLRLSYGISCFLMVLLGAALGLLWRGGQMLAAFAISAVPGSAVIILLVMGREFIKSKSPGSDIVGMGVIWGGIALLAAAASCIYLRLLRR